MVREESGSRRKEEHQREESDKRVGAEAGRSGFVEKLEAGPLRVESPPPLGLEEDYRKCKGVGTEDGGRVLGRGGIGAGQGWSGGGRYKRRTRLDEARG